MRFAPAALVTLALLSVSPARAQVPAASAIRGSDGEVLAHAKVLSFDGALFRVEHDGGIAKVPWEQMPATLRRDAQPDPERAAREAAERQRTADAGNRQVARENYLARLQRYQVYGWVVAKRKDGFILGCDQKTWPKTRPAVPSEFSAYRLAWTQDCFVPSDANNAGWKVNDWVAFIGIRPDEATYRFTNSLGEERDKPQLAMVSPGPVLGRFTN